MDFDRDGYGTDWVDIVAKGTQDAFGATTEHICALSRDGNVECWGAGTTAAAECGTNNAPEYLDCGQAIPRATDKSVHISIGLFNTCVVNISGDVECWGSDLYGVVSEVILGHTDLITVETGNTHACALIDTGTILCWGDGGSLGYALGAVHDDFVTLAVRSTTNCGARLNNMGIHCWGEDVDSIISNAPTTGDYEQLRLSQHTDYAWGCALSDSASGNVLYCWGDDTYGQLPSPPLNGQVDFDISSRHGCSLDSIGQITCWGITDDSPDDFGQVTNAPTDSGYTAIGVGENHSCALDSVGKVLCWGSSEYGQGTDVPMDAGYVTLSVGDTQICAGHGDGRLVCWGSNMHRQVEDTPKWPVLACFDPQEGNARPNHRGL